MSTPLATARHPFLDRWVFFSWWGRANEAVAEWPRSRRWLIITAAIAAGVFARLWAASTPSNYDFDSYQKVADHFLSGNNPLELGRYNYGPIWLLMYTGLRWFLDDPQGFRIGIALLLAAADIAIVLLLAYRRYPLAACLFVLAPITIAISGQHQQFDNIAVALALGAAILLRRDSGSSRWYDVGSIGLLGLSLSTKHDFLLLPLWFAYMQRTWLRRIAYAVIPLLIFGMSLIPFWLANAEYVERDILGYKSNVVAPVYNWLLSNEIVWGAVNRGWILYLFLAVMAVLGWFYRRLPAFDVTLIYGIALVLFSSSMYDQYFAIPVAGVAFFLNIAFLLWIGYVSVYLFGEPADINLWPFTVLKLHLAPRPDMAYQDHVAPLFFGWLIMTIWLWRQGRLGGIPKENDA